VATSIFSLVLAGLAAFSAFSIRMISRNLATNHTHEVVRISDLQFLRYLHEAGSAFQLVNFDGTNYTDFNPAVTTDVDGATGRFVSERANGVRFRQLGGGPFRLTADTSATNRTLSFNFLGADSDPYIPKVGDKLLLPLIGRECEISAVSSTPTVSNPISQITIADTGGLGFSLNATATGNITTGYIYRSAAFTVWGNTLRYHSDFASTRKSNFTVVRQNITSPKPFGLLYTNGSADDLNLRISLEAYDGAYSARLFSNGATTLQALIPTRTVPPLVNKTNSY
jgi:hypothetical protein